MDALPDVALAALAARGHDRAWRSLVSRYRRLVYSVPSRLRLSGDDAEDVFQHTFLKLHEQLKKGEPPQHFPRWLVTVARNESLRLLQFQGRSTELNEDWAAGDEGKAEEHVASLQRAHLIRGALAKLRERCRELIAALYVRDESYTDVQDKLGIPVGAIGPTRARCLEQLRKLLPKEI